VASELRPGESFPVAFSFDFESAETAVSIESAMRASATENQLRLEGLSIELLISQLNPADLMAVLESMSITPDPGVLARAGTSTSVNFSGDGTVDFRTMALDLRGVMQLPDGAMLPLTIGGTLEAPSIELEASR
jgi:hypothetical protein